MGGVNYLKQYYVFFLIGYACACLEKEKIYNITKALFFLLAGYYILYKLAYGIESVFPSQMLAFLMITILYLFVHQCQRLFRITEKNIMCWLGRNSLYLYLYQFLCLNIGIGTGSVRVISIFCTSTAISVALALLLNRSKKIRTVLFGEF